MCALLMAAAIVSALPSDLYAVETQRPANPKPEAAGADLEKAARNYFPSDDPTAAPARLFRLTRDQIDATVAQLLPGYGVKSIKTVMARDPLQTNYEYAELLSVNPANFGALSAWIGDIAARVARNPAGVVNCAAESNAENCLRTAAQRFATRAFRGDVSSERLAQIGDFYLAGVKSAGLPQATSELVEIVLSSPNFLFRKEIDFGRNNRLAPAQLLQAVTYTLADAPPEKFNLESANAGQYLRSSAEAAATIGSIIRSAAAREKLQRFFRTWLEVREPADFTISTEVFPEFTPRLASAMVDETNRFLAAQLGKTAPKLKDITQSLDITLPKALQINVAALSADPIAAKLAELDPEQRFGIFSQPAVLASHSGPTNTRPIKRGVFFARKVLCMEMEPPPKELHAKLYDIEGVTERQRIEQSTDRPACAGCHKIINPLGFFQENFDALGRWRTVENRHQIDAGVLIDFLDEGAVKTTTPAEALAVFTGSTRFKQCFARQLFRFYMGRNEEPADDPVLRRMFQEFSANDEQDILKTLFVLTSSDRMVRRQ